MAGNHHLHPLLKCHSVVYNLTDQLRLEAMVAIFLVRKDIECAQLATASVGIDF